MQKSKLKIIALASVIALSVLALGNTGCQKEEVVTETEEIIGTPDNSTTPVSSFQVAGLNTSTSGNMRIATGEVENLGPAEQFGGLVKVTISYLDAAGAVQIVDTTYIDARTEAFTKGAKKSFTIRTPQQESTADRKAEVIGIPTTDTNYAAAVTDYDTVQAEEKADEQSIADQKAEADRAAADRAAEASAAAAAAEAAETARTPAPSSDTADNDESAPAEEPAADESAAEDEEEAEPELPTWTCGAWDDDVMCTNYGECIANGRYADAEGTQSYTGGTGYYEYADGGVNWRYCSSTGTTGGSGTGGRCYTDWAFTGNGMETMPVLRCY